ncbi:MbtH family protein [Frankia sp. CcI49]|uniref:MbtH family protein n=1 Tax=unclassified Frankia TaxID=2632575 RepID=UPI0006CA2A75|nr:MULTISPECIES: MbtH family NRPS accessory protein [unclassified Frankia]KPM52541.1 antibiotic synthesis protein MbtH [Frankia sp. R43]ONH59741.1 MbtH family protein [Frankia sp. CcI49]
MGLTASAAEAGRAGEATGSEPGFQVVVNSEGQYSIWPADRECPAGWFQEGTSGGRQECLDHIEQVWTDMRPRSLREHMARVTGS